MIEVRMAIITCLMLLFWGWVAFISIVVLGKLGIVEAVAVFTVLAPMTYGMVQGARRDWK